MKMTLFINKTWKKVLYVLINVDVNSDSPGGVFVFVVEQLKPSSILIVMTTNRKQNPEHDQTSLRLMTQRSNQETIWTFHVLSLNLTWSRRVKQEEDQQRHKPSSSSERRWQTEPTSYSGPQQTVTLGGPRPHTLYLYCRCVRGHRISRNLSSPFIKHRLSSSEGRLKVLAAASIFTHSV